MRFHVGKIVREVVMKKVSVIVPAYNVEKYIDECLSSIVNQTYSNLEIVLIDDGSLDKTGEKCAAWAALDKRIKFIPQENQGSSGARNTGLLNSSGDYLMFVDSDDFMNVDCIRRLVEAKEKENADISVCSFQRCRNAADPIKVARGGMKIFGGPEYVHDIVGFLSIGAYAWGKLFDRSQFDGISFPIGRLWEDVFTIPYILWLAEKKASLKNQILMLGNNLQWGIQRRSDMLLHQAAVDNDEKSKQN